MATTDPLLDFDLGRRSLAVLALSAGGAVALFRLNGDIWPLYLLVSLAVVGLYAVAFTRGEALGQVAVLVGLTTLLWGLWDLIDWANDRATIQDWPIVQSGSDLVVWVTDHFQFAPFPIWAGAILWAGWLALGQAPSPTRTTAAYFLTTGAFVLGLWGVFSVLIELDALSGGPLALALLLTVGLPLLLLTVLLLKAPPDQSGAALFALVMLIVSSYVVSVEFLFELIDRWLGAFLPDLLNRTIRFQSIEPDWFERFSTWRRYFSFALVALTFASLLGLSTVQAATKVRGAPRPAWYLRNMLMMDNLTSVFTRMFRPFIVPLLRLALVTYLAATFVLWWMVYLVRNLLLTARDALRYIVQILLPIVALSAVAIMIIVIVRALADYRSAVDPSPRVIWSQSLTVMIVGLALTVAAVGLTQGGRAFLSQSLQTIFTLMLWSYAGLSVAVLGLTTVLYVAVSSLGGDTTHVRPGPLLLTNFIALLVFLVFVFLIFQLAGFAMLRQAPVILGIVLIASALIGASLGGARPIYTELRRASGYGDTVRANSDDRDAPAPSDPSSSVTPTPPWTATVSVAAPTATAADRQPTATPRTIRIGFPTRTPVANGPT